MIKAILIKTLALFNTLEGVIHLVTASISFYGMYDLGLWDWRVATAPTCDMILGIFSLITGYVLNSMDLKHSCLGVGDEDVRKVEDGPVTLPFPKP